MRVWLHAPPRPLPLVLLPRSLSGRGEVDVLLTVEAQTANPVRINIK